MADDIRSGDTGVNLNQTDTNEGFVNRPHMTSDRSASGDSQTWFGGLFSGIGQIPRYGMNAFGSLNRTARSNPWFSIAVIGLGAAALGYYFGRDRFSRIRGGRPSVDGGVITYTYEEELDGSYDE